MPTGKKKKKTRNQKKELRLTKDPSPLGVDIEKSQKSIVRRIKNFSLVIEQQSNDELNN